MTAKRLPSFNDVSPGIIGDLRTYLAAVPAGGGDDEKVIKAWADAFFDGKQNKRSRTNLPATLRSTGLSTGARPMELSPFGQSVLAAKSPTEAAQIFCAEMIKSHNGDALLKAIASLRKRGEAITKESLKSELKKEGIESLSNNTTDHSTLRNWMVAAKIIDEKGVPDESLLKKLIGTSAAEMDEWSTLPLAQQVFLRQVRRAHLVEAGPFLAKDLLKDCLDVYPDLFDTAQFAKQIQKPLASAGWLTFTGLATGSHGGKSGNVIGTAKLLGIPADRVIPDFESVVPAELRAKISTPLAQIKNDLHGTNTHLGGLALELLALRMVIDLGLEPRSFRLRSSQSAHAEVDLLAEGSHLMFSRWTVQCKRYGKDTKSKVGLSDVAKEVGIALFVKAHVVVMVTTTSFSADAKKYADVISAASPLQFLFIDGKTVDSYLDKGKTVLLEHARQNAASVMAQKRGQPVPEIPLE